MRANSELCDKVKDLHKTSVYTLPKQAFLQCPSNNPGLFPSHVLPQSKFQSLLGRIRNIDLNIYDYLSGHTQGIAKVKSSFERSLDATAEYFGKDMVKHSRPASKRQELRDLSSIGSLLSKLDEVAQISVPDEAFTKITRNKAVFGISKLKDPNGKEAEEDNVLGQLNEDARMLFTEGFETYIKQFCGGDGKIQKEKIQEHVTRSHFDIDQYLNSERIANLKLEKLGIFDAHTNYDELLK